MSWSRTFAHALVHTRFLIVSCLFVVALGLGLGVAPASAVTGIVHQINYQGKLLDPAGDPVADGTYQMKLSLYNVSSGGTPIWTAKGLVGSPTALAVSVANGLFTVSLGDTSVGGGTQNALTGLDWNQDALYLGVTVDPDVSEMTPRKQLNAVAQAFNAEQLQGMYASSTALSGSALFIVNQTSGTAASSARTALEVRSSGTSNANDFLIRGINSASSPVFTVSRTGSVTSTDMNATGHVRSLIGSGTLTASFTTSTVIGSFGTFLRSTIVQGRYGYLLSSTRGLDIVDVSGASGLGSLGNLTSPTMQSMAISGNYIFGGGIGAVTTIDVSNPAAPVVRASYSTGIFAGVQAMAVQGSQLYVGYFGQLLVFDISDPKNLKLLGSLSNSSSNYFTVSGSKLYLSDNGASFLRIYDMSVPGVFTQVGSVSISGPNHVTVQGSLLVVRTNTAAFSVFDVSNPAAPTLLSSQSIGAFSTAPVILRGRYMYLPYDLGGVNDVLVYDMTNPRSPFHLDSIIASHSFSARAIAVAGNTLYVPGATTLEQYELAQVDVSGLKAAHANIGQLALSGSLTAQDTINALGGLTALGGITADTLSVNTTSSMPIFQAINDAATTTNAAWGGYINSLLVGSSPTATGTRNYRMVLAYDSSQTSGLCIDDTTTPETCLSTAGNVSLIADRGVTANGFDLAERYQTTGDVIPGDVLVMDTSTSTHVTRSTGIPYDPRLIGIVSTQPGFTLGMTGGTAVALTGRVPTFVSTINGSIAVGDSLTSSIYPGVAMKATKPGKVLGYALEAADTTSTIEVFVKIGYDAGTLFANDGTDATMQSNLVVAPQQGVSEAVPLSDSWGLTFRGRAWDGVGTTNADYLLSTQMLSTTSSQWSIRSASSTLFAVDQLGNTSVGGDLALAGKLFPSARGVAQHDKYVFLDTGPASSTYIATNADGWQSNDSYDFAERYYSPDALTPGDVVVVSQQGRFHVQRAMNGTLMPMGIVSTKPGFVTGAPATSTYPIALAGRVPTHVSIINGPIAIGDLLAPSDIPGVAVKATKAGPVVGQALEAFSDAQVGLIEVFVQAGWWGGPTVVAAPEPVREETQTPVVAGTKIYQGLARITTRGTKVHVEFPSVGTYPLVQVTPYGEIEGGWWTQNYTHTGFDIILKQAQMHELTFAWRVEGMTPEQSTVPLSDGSIGQIDLDTGALIPKEPVEETNGAPSATVPTPPAATEPEPETVPVIEIPVSSSTEESVAPVVTPEEPVAPVETVPTVPVEPTMNESVLPDAPTETVTDPVSATP